MASLLLRRRHAAHPSAAAASTRLLRAFSALPDVDPSASPAATRTPAAPTPTSAVLDLQLAVRAEADPARIHSLVASALSNHDLPRLHTSRQLFSLATSRLTRLRRPDLAASLLHQLLASAPPSPGLLARALSLFPGHDDAFRAFSASPPAAAAGFASASGGRAHFPHHYLASSAGSDPHGCCGTISIPRPRQPQDQKRLPQREESIQPVHASGALRPHL
jgi:hypothetical protein